MVKVRKNPALLFLGGLLGLNILAWLAVYDLHNKELEVIFFDVGQGDSALIKTSLGHHILIDGGPGSVVLEKLGKELPFWKRSIDLIILTHPHHDHLSGFIDVLKRYKVKNILWTGVLVESIVFKEWLRLTKEEKANIYIAQVGQLVRGGNAVLKVLYPFDNLADQKIGKVDNTSIVIKLFFRENSFLWTGDAFQEVEIELVRRGADLKSNVLQVGHHGSRTSTAAEFIAAVLPEIAVISAGKNNIHSHPHEETLETLISYGINVLRTDMMGDIKIVSDGKRLNLAPGNK